MTVTGACCEPTKCLTCGHLVPTAFQEVAAVIMRKGRLRDCMGAVVEGYVMSVHGWVAKAPSMLC